MVNVAPRRFGRPFTMRGDGEFDAAVRELQHADLEQPPPSKSEVIRQAVLEARDRKRKERRK